MARVVLITLDCVTIVGGRGAIVNGPGKDCQRAREGLSTDVGRRTWDEELWTVDEV